MNRKSIIALASCLSVCAVVGVGFSSWLIVNNSAEATADGSITVDTVEDKRVTMTAVMVKDAAGTAFENGESSKIVYGAPDDAKTATGKWLVADANAPTENLKAYVKVTINNADQLPTGGIKFTVAEKGNEKKYATALSSNYVAALPSYTVAKADLGSGTNNTVTYVQEITFAWGTAFEGKNPYEYYNEHTVNEITGTTTYGDDAQDKLSKFNKALDNVSYTLTIATVND